MRKIYGAFTVFKVGKMPPRLYRQVTEAIHGGHTSCPSGPVWYGDGLQRVIAANQCLSYQAAGEVETLTTPVERVATISWRKGKAQ